MGDYLFVIMLSHLILFTLLYGILFLVIAVRLTRLGHMETIFQRQIEQNLSWRNWLAKDLLWQRTNLINFFVSFSSYQRTLYFFGLISDVVFVLELFAIPIYMMIPQILAAFLLSAATLAGEEIRLRRGFLKFDHPVLQKS